MRPICIHRPEYDVVLENHAAVDGAQIQIDGMTTGGHPGEADDARRCRARHRVSNHRRGAGALDDDVRFEALEYRQVACMILPAQSADQLRLWSFLHAIEDVNVESTLTSHQRGEKPDRAGAGDEHGFRPPRVGTASDTLRMIPGLGDNTGRFDKHTERAERRSHRYGELRFQSEPLASKSVALLDAAFRVAAIATHVPFTGGAIAARYGIGAAHDSGDEIAGTQVRPGWRFEYAPDRLVAE